MIEGLVLVDRGSSWVNSKGQKRERVSFSSSGVLYKKAGLGIKTADKRKEIDRGPICRGEETRWLW